MNGFWPMLMLCATGAWAAEYHVATNGSAQAAGSAAAPWDLATALAQTNTVGPGDVIWLQGGLYQGAFRSWLSGSATHPITVRQAPGQRAIIDCQPGRDAEDALFVIGGSNVVWWGFELTCSNTQRVTELPGSWPADLRRGGVDCAGSQMKFVNLLVHDMGNGFGLWSAGVGGEVTGCLIYFNGWRGPDRSHGHGIYAQNREGTKRFAENILFANFGYGIHCYGSESAWLRGFDLEGNVSFNNGALAGPGERAPNLFVGGGSPVERVSVRENYAYGGGCPLRLGYPAPQNVDAVVSNNYLCGERVHILFWERLIFTNNTVIAPDELVVAQVKSNYSTAHWRWEANTYRRTRNQYAPFNLIHGIDQSLAYNFAQWQTALGFDLTSRYQEGQPTGLQVAVRPNPYEPGRGHLIVYNWDRLSNVVVNLDSLLATGQTYTVVNAQNFHGPPVLADVHNGRPISLPMSPSALAQPVGLPEYPLPITQPEFGVFVVLPGPPPTPYQSWKTSHGLPLDTAETNDADQDGAGLLIEYALGLNPTRPDAAGQPAFQATLELEFYRARTELTYQVQSSTNLLDWTPLVSNPGQAGQTVRVPFPTTPATAGFLRLKISLP